MLLLLLACTPETSEATRHARADSPGSPADTPTGETEDTSGETTPVATPAVEILSPGDGALVANPVAFRVRISDVDHAVLDADGYELGTVETDGLTEVEYTFSGTGYARVVTLTGYSTAGETLATDTITMEIEPEETSLDVPYFYQYDNTYEPGSTCGVTSAAMLVDTFHTDSVTPDSLYLAYGKAQGQSPSALAALYEAEGLYADWTTSGTRAQIRAHLDAGRPVVVHGYWTGSGHVTVIVGYSDTDWIVNDPAGDWYICYGCGEADHVRYPLDGAWDEELSWDGDIWFSTADTAAF